MFLCDVYGRVSHHDYFLFLSWELIYNGWKHLNSLSFYKGWYLSLISIALIKTP